MPAIARALTSARLVRTKFLIAATFPRAHVRIRARKFRAKSADQTAGSGTGAARRGLVL